MKKIVGMCIIVLSILTLTGCGKEKEPVAVKLNEDNFSDYFILDVQLKNYKREEQTDLISRYEYRGSADLVATVRPKKDVTIEDVVINGKIITSGMTWAGNVYQFTLELDKDGKA